MERKKKNVFGVINGTVDENCAHLPKKMALERLGEDIGPHFLCGAVVEVNVASIISILNEEVFGADMFYPGGSQNAAVFLMAQSTHVILKDYVGVNGVPLSL